MSVCVCVVNIFNLWHTCYCSCAVCVCLSVISNLISGASVHPENTVTYSVGNVGRNICGVFSKTTLFQSYSTALYDYSEVGHFVSGNT